MAPIREIQCGDCSHIFEEILRLGDPKPPCVQCDSKKTVILPSAHGGYTMNSGPSSVRPKGAGSFKRSK